jgi:hypothetical protein
VHLVGFTVAVAYFSAQRTEPLKNLNWEKHGYGKPQLPHTNPWLVLKRIANFTFTLLKSNSSITVTCVAAIAQSVEWHGSLAGYPTNGGSIPAEARDFPHVQKFHNSCGAHSASIKYVTGIFSQVLKRPRREANNSPSNCIQVTNI